jgi:two-component system, OmpR family, heavy metal sensor histidine kinase CusS
MSTEMRHGGSLRRRISSWLALQSIVALGGFCIVVYAVIAITLSERQEETLAQKQVAIEHLLRDGRNVSDVASVSHLLNDYLAGHDELSLSVLDGGGHLIAQSQPQPPKDAPTKARSFDVKLPADLGTGRAALVLDMRRDASLLERLAWTLALAALGGSVVICGGGYALVARGLRPLQTLVQQTSAVTANRLDVRLDGVEQAEELQPLIEQTNALLSRLASAYGQMEAFNADVAHELNSPISILIGTCEVALRRPRSPAELREVLESNLEELRRIAGIVADMLFLSNAERGAVARRGEPQSLAKLATEVVDYHEAALHEAGLRTEIRGDTEVAVDAGLVRRALSNLVGNATRFAAMGSTVWIDIDSERDGGATLSVCNIGRPIPAEHLPRLFDRFYRIDAARTDASRNHGLGLSIVAAISRMHGGTAEAVSTDGYTTIGFTVKAQRTEA